MLHWASQAKVEIFVFQCCVQNVPTIGNSGNSNMYMIIKYEAKTLHPIETTYQYTDNAFNAAKNNIEEYQARIKKIIKTEAANNFMYGYYKYDKTTDGWIGIKDGIR